MKVSIKVLGWLTLAVALLTVARIADPLPEGLTGTYMSGSAPDSPLFDRIDSLPSTDVIQANWDGGVPSTFNVAWNGALIVFRKGTYSFATRSDDGSSVVVDGAAVVDNSGEHGAQTVTGSISLEPGIHPLFVQYQQQGGAIVMDLLWGKRGGPLATLPSWRLFPKRPTFPRALVSVAVRLALPPVAVVWVAALLVGGAIGMRHAAPAWIDWVRADPIRLALAAVIVVSVPLNLIPIWWGIPSLWAGDEMSPAAVYYAISRKFSGGWWDRYPPFHYFVLAAFTSPALIATYFKWVHLSSAVQDDVLIVMGRLASIVAGVGVLIGTYLCGARVFGRRAGVFAAAMMSVLTLFLYYAKTANPEVPYIFWFVLSLWFLLRFLDTLALRDVLLFATAAVLSMCSKDQAYGLYLVTPFIIVHRLWETNRAQGRSRALLRAVFDPRILLTGGTVAALFAIIYVLPFNLGGFVNHFKDITGPGSEPWRMFEPTPAGRAGLFWLTLVLNQHAWGWPFAIACATGAAIALGDVNLRRPAVYLLLVGVSYYAGFIDLVLYAFDRYVLPLCVLEALFGGLALDRLVPDWSQTRRSWRWWLVGTAFAYTFLYAATVDVLMIRDSRYAAERWLRPRLPPGASVGVVFPKTVLPRLGDIPNTDVGTIDDLRSVAPPFFILNADYARAVPPDSTLAAVIAGLRNHSLGYHLAFRYRAPAPWAWLGGHPDLVGSREETRVLSILRDINPTIEIYERDSNS